MLRSRFFIIPSEHNLTYTGFITGCTIKDFVSKVY